MAVVSFRDQGTEDVFDRLDTKAARRKLDQINQASVVEDLRSPPGNRLEALKGDRAGQHSIKINDQYRVCFVWAEGGAEEVEITDYHQ